MTEPLSERLSLPDIALVCDADYTGIEHRLKQVSIEVKDASPNVSGKFFYLHFKGKKASVEEFVNFIYSKLIYYCIPKKRRDFFISKYEETADLKYMLELVDAAKNLFIKAKKSIPKAGEPGELILFIINEYYLKAPQVVSKMYLKTSESMPVHGTDGIHMSYDEANDCLNLYWGESKIYQNLSASLDEICKSIKSFTDSKTARKPKDRDVDIIKSNLDVKDKKTEDALLKYFDPYEKESNNLREIYCCLSIFDYELYEKLEQMGEDEIEEYFLTEYIQKINTTYNAFFEKSKKHGIQDLQFVFILLPFPDVAYFRQEFFRKLGINPEEVKGESND
ncbi:MAG: hypothetical protein CMQ34_08745 [Gammaproteobacteria bacterium]|nr:hypothetical protein [Gammaproteobacteria bacterium]|tara:strand:- start:172 stop:1179 length:1008 start_codon:yes stop_codon:yes gene_type:complete